MAWDIPSPTETGNGLLKGFETGSQMMSRLMQNKLTPYQIELLKAQAQQAQGAGAKNQMFAQLMQQVMGIGGNPGASMDQQNQPGITSEDEKNIASMQPGQSYVVGSGNQQNSNGAKQKSSPDAARLLLAMMGKEPQYRVVDGQVVEINPLTGGMMKTQVGETPEQKRLGETKSRATQKALENIYGSYETDQELQSNLQGLQETINNPKYKNLAGTAEGQAMGFQPFGVPINSILQKRYSEEDRKLYGNVTSYMGNINTAFGSKFKGAYKGAVDNLIKSLKPNISDTVPVAQGKVNALNTLYGISQQRKELIDKGISEGKSPIEAAKDAERLITFDKIKNDVLKAQVAGQAKSTHESKQGSNPPGTVIMFKNGIEYHIPKEKSKNATKYGYSYDR